MKKHKIILVLNGELPKKDHLISKVEKYDKHSAKEPQTTYLDADPQDFCF